MRAAVFGAGATGARIARHLAASDEVSSVRLYDPQPDRAELVVASLPPTAQAGSDSWLAGDFDVAVIASPSGTQARLARRVLAAGAAAVTTSDDLNETRTLLGLDQTARRNNLPLIVGAGYMPGLSCLLARLAAVELDRVDEIHVAKVGTGGPACARQHHRALSGAALDWRDWQWTRRPGGSGRELCWFPDPVAGQDCYRAALPDALLLVPAFTGVERVTARLAATRRDRLSAPLPMLRRPHPEGGLGALRVEVRGRKAGEHRVVVLGSLQYPAAAAAAVAAQTALHLHAHAPGAGARGLATLEHFATLLQALAAAEVRASRFEGFAPG